MEKKIMLAAERLVVAADFKPDSGPHGANILRRRDDVRDKVLRLADSLQGTGVYIKVNSILRAYGYGLIDEIHSRGLRVFADLKLIDISETMVTDGELLSEVKPDILTVVCNAGVLAMHLLKTVLPSTEVLGVTVLTSLEEADAQSMYVCSLEDAVKRMARIGFDSQIDGLVSSPIQLGMLRKEYGRSLSLNTPAIRPAWAIVKGDDQNPDQIMTPAKAIMAGADRIIVGRPIIRAENPYDAVMRTLEEIELALAA